LVELSVALRRCRRVAYRKRLTVRQHAITVATFPVAELGQERVRDLRRIRDAAAVIPVVSGHAGGNRKLGANGLPLADDADLIVELVRHRDCTAQRDLLLAEAPHGI